MTRSSHARNNAECGVVRKIEECDREHIGNIKHNSFVGNRNKATKH
jgi:hypothetical protein